MNAQWDNRQMGAVIPDKQFFAKWTRARHSLRSISGGRKLSTAIMCGENGAVTKDLP